MQPISIKVIISWGKEKTGNCILILRRMYKFLRALLFMFDAEQVHYFSMNCLRFFCRAGFRPLIARSFIPPGVHRFKQFNITFSNRVGLAAGFDKNARYLPELEALGFGFVEIGTVTPLPQAGNDKPRLFRLPKDRALINRMGFNNDGVIKVAQRLEDRREYNNRHSIKSSLVIGGNIGKNKMTSNEDAWKDYETCFIGLHDHVDYFVVNVSSPNTPGLRALQEKESLGKILVNLQQLNKKKEHPKPIFLKIAPDLSKEQVDDVIDLAQAIQLDGLVAANTTISREGLISETGLTNETGGLSGAPLRERSTQLVQYIHQKTGGSLPLIASGGIFTGADAQEKFTAGASLVQVWTGFIYEGPIIVKNICKRVGK